MSTKNLVFSPTTGQLEAGKRTDICISFTAQEPVELSPEKMVINAQEILYTNDPSNDIPTSSTEQDEKDVLYEVVPNSTFQRTLQVGFSNAKADLSILQR